MMIIKKKIGPDQLFLSKEFVGRLSFKFRNSAKQIGFQNLAISLYSRNLILWTKADIGIDPEMAFQPESSEQGRSGIQFKQGIERFNVNPWAVPIGFKLSVGF